MGPRNAVEGSILTRASLMQTTKVGAGAWKTRIRKAAEAELLALGMTVRVQLQQWLEHLEVPERQIAAELLMLLVLLLAPTVKQLLP